MADEWTVRGHTANELIRVALHHHSLKIQEAIQQLAEDREYKRLRIAMDEYDLCVNLERESRKATGQI
jgi:hypothetical protein